MKNKFSISKFCFVLASLVFAIYFFASLPIGEHSNANGAVEYWIDNTSVTELNVVNNCVYISNAEELAYLCKMINKANSTYETVDVKLTQNINLKEKISPKKTLWWKPIKKFTKTFDGQGFKIYGMRLDYTATDLSDHGGFISLLTGTIKNVTFEDCYLAADCKPGQNAGIVVGEARGTIENCHVEFKKNLRSGSPYITAFSQVIQSDKNGIVNGSKFCFGGIAGYANSATIKGCSVSDYTSQKDGFNFSAYSNKLKSSLLEWSCIGGIVGNADSATITLCRSNVTIQGVNNIKQVCVGGIVGYVSGKTVVNKCCNYGNITAGVSSSSLSILQSYVGGIAGHLKTSVQISNCYNAGKISGATKESDINKVELDTNNIKYVARIRSADYVKRGYEYYTFTGNDYFVSGDYNLKSTAVYLVCMEKLGVNQTFDYIYCQYEYNSKIYDNTDGYYNDIQKSYSLYCGQHCYKGGIVGYCENGARLTNCYNRGIIDVSDSKMIERFVYKFKYVQGDLFSNGSSDRYLYYKGERGVTSINIPSPFVFNLLMDQYVDSDNYTIGNLVGFGDFIEDNCYYDIAISDDYLSRNIKFQQYIYYKGNKRTENMTANVGCDNIPLISRGLSINILDGYTFNTRVDPVCKFDNNNDVSISVIFRNLDNGEFSEDGIETHLCTFENKKQQGISGISLANLENGEDVWAVDEKINGGYPYIKEMYWQSEVNTNTKPLLTSIEYEFNDATEEATVKKVLTDCGEIAIPQTVENNGVTYTVTAIGDEAFTAKNGNQVVDNNVLTDVTLPDTITIIGEKAFFKCRKLENINIPTKLITLEDQAFDACNELSNVKLPNTLKTIGKKAFASCYDFTEIVVPNSVETIGESAFAWTHLLEKISVPFIGESRNATGKKALFGYFFLGDIVNQTYYTTIEQRYSVDDASLKQKVHIPNNVRTVIITDVDSIEPFAFQNCSMLTTIELSNDITVIGKQAFIRCTKLETINIPTKLITLEDQAFDACFELSDVSLPETLKTIGKKAFASCYDFTEIVVPNSVETIGESAFAWTHLLETISVPFIGASRSATGKNALFGYFFLGKIENQSLYTTIEQRYSETDDTLKQVVNIPKNVKTVIITDNNTIAPFTFYNCSMLTSITLPKSTTTIGESAFSGCSGLTSIIIPKTVTLIGENVLSGCSALTTVTIPFTGASENAIKQKSLFGYLFGTTSYTGSVQTRQRFKESSGVTLYYLPSTLTKVNITATDNIKAFAFDGCVNIKEVNLNAGVKILNDGCFYGCYGLQKINLQFVTQIKLKAFYDCIKLNNLTFSYSLTYIGGYAFYNNKSLRILDFSKCNNLSFKENTNGYEFANCYSLIQVTLPSSLTYLTEGQFSNCKELLIINLANIKNIPAGAFYDCVKLGTFASTFNLLNVTTIGRNAFYNCGFKQVRFSSKLNTVNYGCFSNCASLTKIIYEKSSSDWLILNANNKMGLATGITIACSDGTITQS